MKARPSIFCAPECYARYWQSDLTWDETKKCYVHSYIDAEPLKHDYRSVFASDRDRILFCDPFLRLASKTQVFHAGNDHLRTRLTHTLEVSQIARTISETLGLDCNLTEAIALGHDIGHTPFGHVGERTINEISQDEKSYAESREFHVSSKKIGEMREICGFKHNQQSVRVLVEYSGSICLTNFCLYGVRNHSKVFWKDPRDVSFYKRYDPYCSIKCGPTYSPSWSVEALVVYWADEIAQRHHDIEDAFRCDLMTNEDVKILLSKLESDVHRSLITQSVLRKIKTLKETNTETRMYAKTFSSLIVDLYVSAIIKEISKALESLKKKYEIQTRTDFIKTYFSIQENEIQLLLEKDSATTIFIFDNLLHKLLDDLIIPSFTVQRQDGKGKYIIRKLINAYITNPQQLPDSYIRTIFNVEVPRYFNEDQLNILIHQIQHLGSGKEKFNFETQRWTTILCRHALKLLWEDSVGQQLIYPLIFRAIFDFVSSMTDSFAQDEYSALYSK